MTNKTVWSKARTGVFKKLAAFLVRYSGVPFFIRNFYARNKCCIVFYHDPKPDVLDEHLAYLSRLYNIITLEALVQAIDSKDRNRLTHKSMVICFDDGHKGNFALLSVFTKYGIRPTIYLTSQLINTNRLFWFMIPGVDARKLKKLANHDRLRYVEVNFGHTPAKEYAREERQALNSDEIRAMQSVVDFQAHTRFHPILTVCSDEECRREILQCKSELESMLGAECKHFCYPNGDYTEREVELVRQAGFISARTTDVGWNSVKTDPYRLKAIDIPDDASINMLAAKLSGIPGYICHLRMGSFNGKRPVKVQEQARKGAPDNF